MIVEDEIVEETIIIDEASAPAAPPPPPPAPLTTTAMVEEPVEVVAEVPTEAPAEAPVEALYTAATPPQQVVYVQAPVPPQLASNRGVGATMAVVAAIVYGVLLAGVAWVINYAMNGATDIAFLASWDFYIPVAVFVVALIVVVLLVNRAGWGAHVFGSLCVGAAVYFGSIGIILLVNWLIWQVAPNFAEFAAAPFYIIAAILAREVALWFGLIIARRGKKVTARNAVARAEFDAKLAEFRAGAY